MQLGSCSAHRSACIKGCLLHSTASLHRSIRRCDLTKGGVSTSTSFCPRQARVAARARGRPCVQLPAAAAETDVATANCSSSEQEQQSVAEHAADSHERQEHTDRQGCAVLRASKTQAISVVGEHPRPLGDYMTLPASQYSVLDAKRVERLSDDTFRCYVGGISFLNFEVEPVLTVSVTVEERGPIVRLLATELEGSPTVRAINDRFTATMTNVVWWREGDTASAQENQIVSDTSIKVTLEVPRWLRFMPTQMIEGAGSQVMQGVLNSMVPRFLAQLRKDYELWAQGDDARQQHLGVGEL